MPGKVFLSLALAVPLLLEAAATAAAPAGVVIASQGPCFSLAAGQRVPLNIGAVVNRGDVVRIPAAAKLKLRMNDGSIISAASDSEFTIGDYSVDAAGRRLNALLSLRSGLLRALVTSGGAGKFEIETPVGIASVTSTDWFISADPGAERVGVLSGEVMLTSRATDRSVAIPARWGTRLEAGLDPVLPRLWKSSEFAEFIQLTDVNSER